jgi:2-keto-3-deoxy-L-rhamnonate aldolase RhmA
MTFRDRLHGDEQLIGTLQIIDSAMVSELIAGAGMDFVAYDQEHGPLTAETTQTCAMGAECGGAAPIVRVRDNTVPEIQRALDIGTAGVQVPQVETAAEAEDAVRAARYPPLGERGLSQYVRAGDYVGQDDYAERQNETTAVLLQVEGEAGLDNLDDILAVEGYDAIFLGPYDISSSLGIPGQVHDGRVEDLMADACDAAAAAGIAIGTFADDPDTASRWFDAGVDYVELGVAAGLFGQGLAAQVDAIDTGA